MLTRTLVLPANLPSHLLPLACIYHDACSTDLATLSVVNLLRGLTTVINQDSDSISVTRTAYGVNSGRVGYLWTITFVKQHGDVPPLGCTTADGLGVSTLTSTVTASTTRCSVTTTQHGSLITGSFSLGQTFPHAYQGTPKANSTVSMPWNINALNLSYVLSNTLAADGTSLLFGTVSVARVAYIPPSQNRWSGGYLWTLAFVSRNGMLPATTNSKGTLNMNGSLSEVRLESRHSPSQQPLRLRHLSTSLYTFSHTSSFIYL